MEKFDAIVIGAGNGGLAAAAVLSKAGKKVLLIEKSHSPGGFATSFRRGRFEFDVSLHELNGFSRGENAEGGVRALFDHLEISDKIDWIDLPDAYRLISSDSEGKIDARMPFGIENYIKAMERYAPGCAAGMEYIFRVGRENLKVLSEIGDCRGNLDKIKLLARNRDFLHTASKTLGQALAEINMPQRAKNIFKGYWACLGSDSEQLSFFHYLMRLNSYIELGAVIPAARSLEMTNALTDCFLSCGGRLLLNSEVSRIKVENTAVKGLLTDDMREYGADFIICNISPHIVFGKLIERGHIPQGDIKRANFRSFAARGFCVYLGLNKSAEQLGLKDYSYFIFPDADDVKQFKNMGAPQSNMVQNTICPNAVYPAATEPGSCILSMTSLFTSDFWDDVKAEDYFRVKNEFADSMISTFERATGIALRASIEELEIASPESFARFTGTPHGSIYGYLGKKTDGVLARQLTENKRMSGIEGLYFAGGYGNKLNGYSSSMSTGFDAARDILKNSGGEEK